MTKQNYLAIIEIDDDLLDESNALLIANQMGDLKATVSNSGSCDYYHVMDIKALEKFKAELKRLNKL
jgi:hypothetical protein